MNVFLKEKFETGEFLCFALNEDGCTHVAMFANDFDYDEDKFRVAYANYNNKNVKANFMKMIPSKLMVEDVNVYYDNGDFKVNHNGGGDCISKNAILVDNYFCCVEG